MKQRHYKIKVLSFKDKSQDISTTCNYQIDLTEKEIQHIEEEIRQQLQPYTRSQNNTPKETFHAAIMYEGLGKLRYVTKSPEEIKELITQVLAEYHIAEENK